MGKITVRLICALLFIGLAVAAWTSMNSASSEELRSLAQWAQKIEPLHREKLPPGPNDWLARHEEQGQTVKQYVKSDSNRPTARRTTLYLQPIGEFSETHKKLVAETAELLSRYYNLPAKTLDPLGLEVIPAEARRVHPSWGDRQILSTYVLDKVLKPRRPDDAVAVLALTTSDLWPGEGWNFVFGQASLGERVGVWSLYRYGDPESSDAEYRLFRKRMFKVALHETGHMFGIVHCIFHECLMNGSNHLAEMDARPLWLCPVDVQKVWWACKADPVKRYQSLAEFARQHGLDKEARFWSESLERMR
jgi:archaemetzincin